MSKTKSTPVQEKAPILDFYLKQKAFNSIAGKDNKNKYEDLFEQYKLIVEEGCVEGQDAFNQNDAVKLLDSFIDNLFVTLGALQKLETAGFDVEGALTQVADDNLSKFTLTEEEALDTLEHYKKQGIEAIIVFRCGRYAVMNAATSKVLKPLSFKPTDLSKYCPVKKITEIGAN